MPLTSCQTSMTLAAGAESSKVDYMPLHHAAIAMNIAPIPFPLYWLLLFHKCTSSEYQLFGTIYISLLQISKSRRA